MNFVKGLGRSSLNGQRMCSLLNPFFMTHLVKFLKIMFIFFVFSKKNRNVYHVDLVKVTSIDVQNEMR